MKQIPGIVLASFLMLFTFNSRGQETNSQDALFTLPADIAWRE